jgi:hypothetical protein
MRPKYYTPPDSDDLALIAACKAERTRLAERIRELARQGEAQNKRELRKLRREKKELSDANLATKFELKVWAIKDA